MYTLEVVVICGWHCACAILTVNFYLVEHFSPCLRLYYKAHLCKFSCFLQLQMVDLALLLRKHEFQLIPWVQVFNVLPLKFQFVLACRLTINNYQNWWAFAYFTFRYKTGINFFLLAYFEGSGLSATINEQFDIQKGTFSNRSKVKEEILFFELINLKSMEPFSLIQICILTSDEIPNGVVNDLTVLFGSLFCIDPTMEHEYDK